MVVFVLIKMSAAVIYYVKYVEYIVLLVFKNAQLPLTPVFPSSRDGPAGYIDRKSCLITAFMVLAWSQACLIPVKTFSKQRVMGG